MNWKRNATNCFVLNEKSWVLQNEIFYVIIVAPNIPENLIYFQPQIFTHFITKHLPLAASHSSHSAVLINA